MLRRTKVVATLGPATDDPKILQGMVRAGLDVARFNMSHGTHEEHRRRLELLRQAEQETGRQVAVMWDTRGPEIRLGAFAEGRAELLDGELFALTVQEVLGNAQQATVSYSGLVDDCHVGDTLLLDDGNVVLRAERIDRVAVHCRVVAGGVLSDRKKVTLPGVRLSLPSLSDEDRADLAFGAEVGMDFVAASFIRQAKDVLEIRRVLEELGSRAVLISKIETREGVDRAEEILRVSDGVMVARGDMGVEYPPEEVPLIQKALIRAANRVGKPVITATQMLESMVERPVPTRAEASDVANAIFDGTDAVMLSAETASGHHPLQAVEVMAKIAQRSDLEVQRHGLKEAPPQSGHTVTEAISYASCRAAQDLGAAAILTATESGHTARMVARYRPAAPIVAVTPDPVTARSLAIVWGVLPILVESMLSTDEMANRAISASRDAQYIHDGDLVVITAGVPVGIPGTTNMIQVHTVGAVAVRGIGVQRRAAVGRVVHVRQAADLERVAIGDVVVAHSTDREMLEALKKAAAIVTEEGGLTSHAAVVGLSLGIPVIVGAHGALAVLAEGELVTVDGSRGLVYRGEARVL